MNAHDHRPGDERGGRRYHRPLPPRSRKSAAEPRAGKKPPETSSSAPVSVAFDVLDVGKDDRPEIEGKSAKAGVQVDHLAPICTATCGWVVTTALGRVAFAEKFPRKKRTEIRTECRISGRALQRLRTLFMTISYLAIVKPSTGWPTGAGPTRAA